MEKDYSYKENIMWFAEKQIIFREKIAELIEFEKCIIIRNKYTNENPTNNLVAYDYYANKIWEVDDIITVLFKDGISVHIADDGTIKTVIGKAKIKSTWEVVE